ncbi:MAG: HEAT repeat domain-containing protein, partial [Candidatus Uhrbacteria bacterium]|nr:HEAT repeat domain-containing protein [Candidatus Uhrbacteria bacterium]
MNETVKNQSPVALFDEGLNCFKKGDNRKALEFFQMAHKLDRDSHRNASYYGRLLAVYAGDSARGLELCTWALRKEKEVSHYINLGKVYEISGNSMAAQRVYRLGLDYFPMSRDLQEEYWGYSRKDTIVSFLDRTHSLNKRLGILLRRVLPVWNDRYAVRLAGDRLDEGEIRERLCSVFRKIADGKVTREGGAIFLKDLLKRADAGLVVEELERLTACPPSGVYANTILHTLLLTGNDLFIDILSKFLTHEDEEMAGFAARGLAGFRSFDALKVLVRHLDNDGYLCRKAAAEALAEGFGRDGFEALKRHIMAVNGYMYKLTSIEVLLKS